MKRINALTIAGTDPSGGAGIQADLKTFSALGAYGCSVITALVAQNTRGVQSVYRIEPDFVAAQLDSVFSDVRIDTTKIGMLAETDIVEAVAERLQRYQIQNVVLDTVMLAKSGDPLLSPSPLKSVCWRKPILLKRWQNGCNVIRSKTWYSTPLCWQKAATRCFHLQQLPRCAVDYCHRFH